MAEGGEGYIVAQEETSESIPTIEPSVTDQTDRNMDTVDVILQRSISERENELRQIQNNNRPVTGQSNRQNIDKFMTKNIQIRDNVQAQQASGKENVPLNSTDVEEHRPEAVVFEIQGLSQQHRVSNVLQTAAFRRHLEGIIRGSLGTVVRNRSAASSARPSPSPAPTQPATPVRDQTPPSDTVSETSTERRDSVSSSSSSSASSFVESNQRIQDTRGLLNAHINSIMASRLAGHAPPAPAPPAPALPSREQPLLAAPHEFSDVVRDLHREDLVQEVSELVHRRLVTSTLEGEFRNVLEVHVGERVQATGTDGERVANFVRSLPQSQPHFQNDFSNLGIPSADNWDTMSVTSISATAVPYTQTNLHMSREIASLKSQLQEMKNMMKVSFDLQLDIQRAIRQEVAAGIAAATGQLNKDDTVQTVNVPKSKPVSDTHCLICLDNHSDSVLYQCGHMCVCFPCGRHLMDRGAKCPVCRAPIRDIIRAYKCNED